MSETINPFFEQQTTEAFELPILPMLSAGDAAQLQAADDLGVWLTEVGYVGSDETVELAASIFAHFEEARHEFSEIMGIESQDASLESARTTPRELVLGTAVLYAWKELEVQ